MIMCLINPITDFVLQNKQKNKTDKNNKILNKGIKNRISEIQLESSYEEIGQNKIKITDRKISYEFFIENSDSFISRDYCSRMAFNYFKEYVEYGRATNLNECMELYDKYGKPKETQLRQEEDFQYHMSKQLEQEKKNNKDLNRHLDHISSELEYASKKLERARLEQSDALDRIENSLR